MYWREAQYELAKAQLAQKNNIAPKGVQYDWFPKQETGARQARAGGQATRREAEKQKRAAARARTGSSCRQAADQASGQPDERSRDPMAPMRRRPPTTPAPTAPPGDRPRPGA